MKYNKLSLIFCFSVLVSLSVSAGPPFLTDDPEPVDFKHWEYYVSSINYFQPTIFSGTLPHFECNYGIIPNVQIHAILPLNYEYEKHRSIQHGYSNTEFGIKYRFIQESESLPQIGTFPLIEIPTIQNTDFGNGKLQIYLPIWIQKSWEKLTTYGGCGYWINPGQNNKNWLFSGWELQYDFSDKTTLGGEIFLQTPSVMGGKSVAGFNLGGFLNFNKNIHFIYSAGHYFNDYVFTAYLGLLFTI
jgi:hypothetical protein